MIITHKEYFEDGIWIWKTIETRYIRTAIDPFDIVAIEEAPDKTAIIRTKLGCNYTHLIDKFDDVVKVWKEARK